ncbi:hypothetical protein M0R45_000566 [Rubus argutus]|uniref:Uncharacterized protein n=1 Tax=Rubus argutus TaxID=59490 RepID=A0AAW1VP31_RUBAR
MNSSIAGLEKADAFLLVGTQPRVEAAIVNARIRKTVLAKQAKVGYVGPEADLNYEHQHLGTGPDTLLEIAERRHPFSSVLLNAKNPAIIVGAGLFERKDKDAIFSALETIAKYADAVRPDWNGFNVLLLKAAQAAALDLGLVPESENSIESAKFVYLMGADDVNLEKVPADAFVVYQGHHGDRGSRLFGDARDDWKIIRALSEVAGVKLPYDTLGAIRSRIKTVAPNILNIDEREPATFSFSIKPESTKKMDSAPFGTAVDNFYMTDSITRASKIMAQCSALLLKK